jgi:hypothetical protein
MCVGSDVYKAKCLVGSNKPKNRASNFLEKNDAVDRFGRDSGGENRSNKIEESSKERRISHFRVPVPIVEKSILLKAGGANLTP